MEPGTIAYLAASFLTEGILLYSVSRAVWKHRDALCQVIAAGWSQFKSFPYRCATPVSDADKKVMEGVYQFRCWVADRMATYLLAVLGTAVMTNQLILLQRGTGWVSEGQSWAVLAMFAGTAMMKVVPGGIASVGLNAFYLYSCLLCIVYVSKYSVPTQSFAMFSLTATAFIRMPLVLFPTRISVVLLANALSIVHAFLRVLTDDFVDGGMFAVRQEFLLFLNIVGFSMIMDRILQQKAELELERGKVASQLSAASSLLRLTCDAVIELDNNLCLTEDSPELAHMLMRTGPRADLKGANFLDFMAQDEAVRTHSFLESEERPSGSSLTLSPKRHITARAFHTRLIDSYNTKICMEVFQVRYSNMDGQKYNLLGLRDFTDVKSLAGENAADAITELDIAVSPSQSVSMYMSEGFSECEGSPGMSQFDSDSSELHLAVNRVGSKKEKDIYLDIDVEGLLVHAASSPLMDLTGKSLREVFPSPHTWLLMQSLHSEAKLSLGTFDRVLTYKDLPFTGLRPGKISGTMHVTKNRFDQIHIMMVFVERASGRQNHRRTGSERRPRSGPLRPPSTVTAL